MKKIYLIGIILTGFNTLLLSKKILGIQKKVIKNMNLDWNLIFSEDFESGNLPNGWWIWENPSDGWTWQIGYDTSDNIHPPNYGTKYLYYCDFESSSGYISHTETVKTNKYPANGYNNFRLSVDLYFLNYLTKQHGIIEVNYKINSTWYTDTLLDFYLYDVGPDSGTLYFNTYYPADSLWLRFIFHCDQTGEQQHWGYGAFSIDNIVLEGAYMSILFVDDDGGTSNDTFFTNALNFLGLSYDTFVVPPGGDGPDSLFLANYDIVIWNTGGEVTNTLTQQDTLNLKKYLTKRPNPHLWLSSQNLLSDLGKAPSWLKISSFTSDVGVSELKGIGPTTEYLNLTLGNNTLPDMADAIIPSFLADTEFVDTLTNNIFALSVYSSQTGHTPTQANYSLFFNSFPFENILPSLDSFQNFEQIELTNRILNINFRALFPSVRRDIELLPISPKEVVFGGIPYDVIVECNSISFYSSTVWKKVFVSVNIIDESNNEIFYGDTNIIFKGTSGPITLGNISFPPDLYSLYTFSGSAIYSGDDDTSNNHFAINLICTEVDAETSKPFTPPPSDQDRLGHTVVHDPVDNKVYMIGGTPDGWPSNNVENVYRYDPVTDTWDQPTTMPSPAVSWTDGVYHNGRIHIFGGLTTSSVPTDRHIAYNTQTGQWEIKASLPEPRAGHRVIKIGNYAYLIGGSNQNGPTNTVYRYDFSNDIWTACNSLPDNWTMGGAGQTNDYEFTLFGGFNDNFGGKWNYALKGQIDPNNPDNINYSYGCPIPQEMQGSLGSNIMVSLYEMGMLYYFILGGFAGQNDSISDLFGIFTECMGVYRRYVVPLARVLKAVLITLPMVNKKADTTDFRIYIFAGDAYGDWNPPNNYYYYIEGNTVEIEEKIINKENTNPISLTTNLMNDNLILFYILNQRTNVDLSIYDLTGRKVATIIKNSQNRGKYTIRVNTRKLKSGVYFLKIKLNDKNFDKKIIKIK